MTLNEIIHDVATEYDVLITRVLSPSRDRRLTAVRIEITRRAYEHGCFQFEIASALGRARSTIWYYQTQINKEVSNANSITSTK